MKNFLPKQYKQDKKLNINHNYLSEQFSDHKKIFKKIEKVVRNNDFTLGKNVNDFEKRIKKLLKANYVVAVGSGTDALMLSLKCLGVKEGDEVITSPYTFYATIGAIVTAGAKPIFVDINDDYNLDPLEIEKKITKKTKAILPVHWSGRICEMDEIIKISNRYKIPIVEDSCHAILAKYKNKMAGNFGDFGCFSLHPLKNLNVWGDGGFVLIKKKFFYDKMMLLRNHGLISRNKNQLFGYNSRLDTIQAVVALHLLKKIKFITNKRISNSLYLDKKLSKITSIILKKRQKYLKEVFHLFEFRVKNKKIRLKLIKFLQKKGIDAKIHYPIPMHLQPAAKIYGYKKGDFPTTEKISNTTISLPVHEYIKKKDLNFIIKTIKGFFNES
ncbi:DegT/DnrJ/EryC1/StrS family aminotransferase [Candidatus Pelagibacter sp. HIMB1593]|uniref:DegT/DnrJ/EryC1/StrS family aminotransferase n=1 Tax=Candidatus Pelagibacter sp. HIMB1593 TaxID=3413355 RepID=UPI003F824931